MLEIVPHKKYLAIDLIQALLMVEPSILFSLQAKHISFFFRISHLIPPAACSIL